jgi:hypothetical protein
MAGVPAGNESKSNSAQSTIHNPHGPDDPSRTINYHHLDISAHDGMEWMSRILVGEMAAVPMRILAEIGQMWLISVHVLPT